MSTTFERSAIDELSSAVNRLLSAVDALTDNGRHVPSSVAMALRDGREALARLERDRAGGDIVATARGEFGCDDIEIDDDALCAVAVGAGVWVSAWVFISDQEL